MRITHPATGRNRSLQIQSNDLDRASRAAKDRDAAPLTRDELHELGAALDEFGLAVPAEEVLVGPTHSRGFRRISMLAQTEERRKGKKSLLRWQRNRAGGQKKREKLGGNHG